MRRRERVWTPGRYDPDGRSVEAAIARVRHAPVEVGYGFDVLRRQRFIQVGDERGIRGFRQADLATIRGGTFVYNHPLYPFPVGDPRRRAGSFSLLDLVFMYENDLTMLIAVTAERTYIVRPLEGGFHLDPKEVEEEYARVADDVRQRLLDQAIAGRLSMLEALAKGRLADEVMDALGLYYDYVWQEAP